MALDAPYFPLFKLPLELRQRVYELVLGDKDETSITKRTLHKSGQRHTQWSWSVLKHQIETSPQSELKQGLERSMAMELRNLKYSTGAGEPLKLDDVLLTTKSYSMLLVNREISKEAKEFLYRGRHFIFPSSDVMFEWLDLIGSCKRFITHMTCEKSGHRVLRECYQRLKTIDRLQYFKITLSASLRAPLAEHITKHYAELKHYLLAQNADQVESLRRLHCIHFAIGKDQQGVLTHDGTPYKDMTPELEEWCKERIRHKVLRHFAQIVS